DEFENGTVDSGFRIGVDYFFLGSLKGIYFPVGFESWRYSIGVKETEVRGKYDMAYLSAGIGYLYPFNKNIYFDSKFSLNASLSNKTEVEIDDRVLFPDKAAYNLFLGVGVKF
nr:hypothetical protein [Nitrospirales bacterium]